MKVPPVTHVIFDFDGLLVDTESVYTGANVKCLQRHGKKFTMEMKRAQMGMRQPEAIRFLLDKVGLTNEVSVDEFAIEYEEYLLEGYKTAISLPGARRLVEHLLDKGVNVAICTGSNSKMFAHKVQYHREWCDRISLIVTSGDDPLVKRGKPFPDPYLETLRRFDVQPDSPKNVLVFEDAPNGVVSAYDAGMQVVWVPDPVTVPNPDPELLAKSTLLRSLEEFVPDSVGLPPYDV